jgi:polyisoprenoid-binding protein YceI
MSSLTRVAALAALTASSLAFAGWTQQGEGSASFKATGPAGFKIVGVAKKLAVKEDAANLVVTLQLADLDTDNGLRNRHMLEDLEAAAFPTCSLSVPVAQLKEGASNVEGTGTFVLHGKTKELPFTYTSSCTAGVCDVEGTVDLNLKDFDIKIRSYLGITVKNDVQVTTKFQVKK